MATSEQTLLSFFEQIARKDTVLLELLKEEPRFKVEHLCWTFTLPDLHAFLQRHDDVFYALDYKPFQQLLFRSPVNQRLKQYGAQIVIADNRNKVDKSIYALIWGTAAPTS